MLRFFTVSRLARNTNPFFEIGPKKKQSLKEALPLYPTSGSTIWRQFRSGQ
jgi:hypothetical protein